jgi:hypothetical protein
MLPSARGSATKRKPSHKSRRSLRRGASVGRPSGGKPVGAARVFTRDARRDGTEGVNDKCFLHFDDGGVSPIDCGKISLCTLTRPCACAANGCTSGENSGSVGLATLSFDLAIAGDAANGTMVGLGGGGNPVNVHLTRAR